MAEDAGLITRQSRHAVSETLQRLEGALAARGFMVFCRIDHSAAATAIGETLAPRTVLIYGNPKIGTAAMASFPTLAIDLPPKLLVWQDEAGKVWVSWNSGGYFFGTIFARHGAAAPAAQIAAYDSLIAQVVAHALE
jgi:uncharacterized protein (DUF302 family)